MRQTHTEGKMLEWIQDKLPDLSFSASYRYNWRSELVIIYHKIQGREFATLYADEGKKNMWWTRRNADIFERLPVEDVLGWLPKDVLPGEPQAKPVWIGEEDADYRQ